jgi:hypothetical protein
LSILKEADRDHNQAMKVHTEVLTDALSAGFILSFDQGQAVTNLLRQVVSQGVSAD